MICHRQKEVGCCVHGIVCIYQNTITDHSENLQLYVDRSGQVMLTGHSVDP